MKERFEAHHGVKINDDALVAAATLSNRYISDRFLPDKAIDLIDEAAAKIRTEIDSVPAELDTAQRRVMRLEIEEAALKRERDDASKRRLSALTAELQDARSDAEVLRARYQSEKAGLQRVSELRQAVQDVKLAIEQAERGYNLDKAAELRHGKLPHLDERSLSAGGSSACGTERASKEHASLSEQVTDDEIARIVAQWTGIPVAEARRRAQRRKLLHLRRDSAREAHRSAKTRR